jgi:hypothetical protein
VGALFVVMGGLFPNAIVARRAAEAETVEQAICVPMRPAQPSARRTDHFNGSTSASMLSWQNQAAPGSSVLLASEQDHRGVLLDSPPQCCPSEVCSPKSLTRLSRAAPNIR